MSVQDGLLSFQMKETIFLSSDKPGIEELRELELLPDLDIRETDHEITICGSLQLRGKYMPTKSANAKTDGGTDNLVSAMKFTPLQLEQGDTNVFFSEEEADIMHRIPLSISVPVSRTKEIAEIYGIVDSFDYEVKGPKQLLITADLKIAGIQLKSEQEIHAEQQSHKPDDTWEYIQVAHDESAEQEYQHVTIDDLERKLAALEKEVEAQLEHQNGDGQESVEEVAHAEQYQPYQFYQPFPGLQSQRVDTEQSSWDQDSATRFRYQHPQFAAYEVEAEMADRGEVEQSSNVPYQTYSHVPEESIEQQTPFGYGFHPTSMSEPPQYVPYGSQPYYQLNPFAHGPGQVSGQVPNPNPFAPPPPHSFQPITGQFHQGQQPPQYPFAQMPTYAPPQQTFYQLPPYPPNPIPEAASAIQYQSEYVDESPYQAAYQPPPSYEYVEEHEQETDNVYAEPASYHHDQKELETDIEEKMYESPYQAAYQPPPSYEYVEEHEQETDNVLAEPASYHGQEELETDIEEKAYESGYQVASKGESSHNNSSEPFQLVAEHKEIVTEDQEIVTKHKEVVTEREEARVTLHNSPPKVQLATDPDPYAKYWEGSEDEQAEVAEVTEAAEVAEVTEAVEIHVDHDENKVHAHTAEYDQEIQAPAISTELSEEDEATVLMAQLEAEEEITVEEIVATPVAESEKEMKVAIGSKNNRTEKNETMNFSNIFSHLHGSEKSGRRRDEGKQEDALEQMKARRTDGSSSRTDALGNLTSFVQDRTEKFSKLKMCIIQKNETLDSIAQRYELSVTKIKEANRMSTDRVEEGQILYIPQ
ncbi:LysM peptidoglycan-binding domain-containing protein [Brevibacterium sp. JNUCC-42]|nr:LysM peptidoglycan-binding domain-containing protein [Brevibacterium sp. JNUCC-42]